MKPKILCIDDEQHNLDTLERVLRTQYEVIGALSGKEALTLIEEHEFALIISDQKMPEMTGVQFFKKAKSKRPDAIRILLTGFTDLESTIRAINLGEIYRYLTKPWDPKELLATVEQAVEVQQMRSQITRQNQELREANEQLASLDKLKTDFMLLVNHELKTPLTAISSFTQLLEEEELTESQALFVKKIASSTERLEALVADTLLLTQLRSQKELTHLESIDVAKELKTVWDKIASQFPNQSLNLIYQGPSSFKQSVQVDYFHIILRKLIENCFTHSHKGSEVHLNLTESSTHWSLFLKNPMVEKAKTDFKALLNEFSKGEDIMNHSGGAGLGLAVIQSIVHLWKGELTLDTKDKDFAVHLEFPQ